MFKKIRMQKSATNKMVSIKIRYNNIQLYCMCIITSNNFFKGLENT